MLPETPLLSLTLDAATPDYRPGETLTGQYQIDVVAPEDIRAVELSVLWETAGKGETDRGVLHFERWDWQRDSDEHEPWHSFSVTLPAAPLSYDGLLVKIQWLVRLRVTLKYGKDFIEELPFRLGTVPRPELLVAAPTITLAPTEETE